MKVKVVNCKKLGIRKTPWIPEEDPEIVYTANKGEILELKSYDVVYDWTGRKFLEVETQSGIKGYGAKKALEILEEALWITQN